jgi:hypothetical protein
MDRPEYTRTKRVKIGGPSENPNPVNFHSSLLPDNELIEFFSLDQSSKKWKTWRERDETVGASAVMGLMPGGTTTKTNQGYLPGASEYQHVDELLQKYKRRIDSSNKYHRRTTLPMMLGHLWEDLVNLGFEKAMELLTGEEKEFKLHSCGVLFDNTPVSQHQCQYQYQHQHQHQYQYQYQQQHHFF